MLYISLSGGFELKSRVYSFSIFVTAIISIIIAITLNASNGWKNVVSFPYAQIASVLRSISLSSSFGNVVAVILFFFICFLPILLYIHLSKRKKTNGADLLLFVLSVALLAILYLMINPIILLESQINLWTDSDTIYIIFGTLLHILIISYITLKLLLVLFYSTDTSLFTYVKYLMIVFGATLTFAYLCLAFSVLIDQLRAISINTWELGPLIQASHISEIFLFIIQGVPFVLGIWVSNYGFRFMEALEQERYSEEARLASERLANVSKRAVILTVLFTLIDSVLQIFLMGTLSNLVLQISFPIGQIVLALSLLVLARILSDAKVLKDENEEFV